MAQAAKVAQDFGFDEVNVNCGCPSNKTRDGCFGAILMFDPELVAQITSEMRKLVTIPVTVKCRLGVDDKDKWEDVINFIKIVSEKGGVNKFIIHARKAYLHGLDPKQNRTIPPLKYDWVFELKKLYPHLNFVINGGFSDVDKINEILKDDHPSLLGFESNGLEGCMSGRMAMNTPWEIARVD
jgi:tRNA-dihydrouridine synthase A